MPNSPQETAEAPVVMQDTTNFPRCPYCNKPLDTDTLPIKWATSMIDMGPGQPYSVYTVIYCGWKKCQKLLSWVFVGAQEKSEEQKASELAAQQPDPPPAPILHSGALAIAELNNLGKPRPIRFRKTYGPN